MQPLSLNSITIDEFKFPSIEEKNMSVAALRLDKIHPIISGNKWFKLKYYLEEALNLNKKHLVSFGGAWSNHIIATAAAGNMYGLKTTGIIRGEEPRQYSETLQQAMKSGMEILFLTREEYALKKIPSSFQSDDEVYIIPEGGYGNKGKQGASEILDYCTKEKYSHICCAAGTGTMLAGLVKACLSNQQVIAINVLKNPAIGNDLEKLLVTGERNKNFTLKHDYHFGGYAKYNRELIDFMNGLYELTEIPTDFVYTAKLFFGISSLISNNFFPEGSNILIIHSGGLQGNSSLPKGTLIF